ncbi:pyridoxal phosphate-dependent aspartate aminotransferase [Oleiphilus messinensis]|uniref:Pyridoxal phosphate-dependent aspartate aminotransferase n=1 Tax=Oleiphilus messinensis TaxID=141451 RepID=A0A1Y0IJG0_9GAMM|nr:LegC family aminotransferase [Oleiphilus messinensis]ARU59573.1 pyridoxal phosphate-dependent aspartate aminotransferase [Oleiphilus messinensis]
MMTTFNKAIVDFVQDTYQTKDFIPLHAPTFIGNEMDYLKQTIDSTFVSSVGEYVNQFESQIEQFTQSRKAVATVNGTSALHIALLMAGVKPHDLVLTQSMTFVATCNVIHHMGAEPLFIDVSRKSLGLCPTAAAEYLTAHTFINAQGHCQHKTSNQIIRAMVPMHTFGHPAELDELASVCKHWNITLVEDAAESLGSYYKGRHTGTIGKFSALSFNGNKIITTGGGGMLLCASETDGIRAKHITTTAKIAHPYEFEHDEAGFNYRMPNLNAALGCAQMEVLPLFLRKKRELAEHYQAFFKQSEFEFIAEPEYAKSNYWLNAIICPDEASRKSLLSYTNEQGVMTRPVWRLMHKQKMFSYAKQGVLTNSEWLEGRLVNLPSMPLLSGT